MRHAATEAVPYSGAEAAPSSASEAAPYSASEAATHPPTGVGWSGNTHPPTEAAGAFRQEQAAPERIPRTDPGQQPTRIRKRRTAPLLVALAVAAVVAAGGGTAYMLTRGSAKHGGTSAGTKVPSTVFPTETMLVRQDTAPGWPQKCHARIARYPTDASAAPAAVTSGSCDILPAYAPGMRKFAFTRRTSGGNQLWTADADGGNAAELVGKVGGGRTAWSPDGGRIAYFAPDDAGRNQLYTVTVADAKVTQLTTDGSHKDDPSWGPSGRIAYYSDASGENQIYVLDPRRPDQPPVRLTKDGVFAKDPSWSPDGTRIAFTHGAYPHGEIWLMQADGSGAHRLSGSSEHEMDPVWARNGGWIAYTRGP
ncbi:hypothetical protein AB0J52_41625, partial [Spirillospora sp. NPDC049652]